jgi:hypothetical protein
MQNIRAVAGVFALVFGLLMFAPISILGSAIGFPASLSYPAEKMLPLLLEQDSAVRLGYGLYLVYSLLFFPVVWLVGQTLGENRLTSVTNGFAALSSLARSIGILRWLTVMPVLAASYSSQDPKTMQVVYSTINAYGGGIGELLGVSLFAALALGLLCWQMLESTVVPKWVAVTGFVTTTGLLLPWLEAFGMDLGAGISLSVALLQVWFMALGMVLLRPQQAKKVVRA